MIDPDRVLAGPADGAGIQADDPDDGVRAVVSVLQTPDVIRRIGALGSSAMMDDDRIQNWHRSHGCRLSQ